MIRPLPTLAACSLAAMSLLAAGRADATCSPICQVVVLDAETCEQLPFDDDFTVQLDGRPLQITARAGAMCCAPPSDEFPDGDCSSSTQAVEPALSGPASGGAWQAVGTCGNAPVLQWVGDLAPGVHRLSIDDESCSSEGVLATVQVVGGPSQSCSALPGTPGSGAWAPLALLGLLALRRREGRTG